MTPNTEKSPASMPREASLRLDTTALLLDSISHKLNNLLGTMVGSADMLADDIAADSPLREDIDRLRAAGEQTQLFMRCISEFSRNHQQPPEPRSLPPVLESTLAALRPAIPPAIQIRVGTEDCQLPVHCGEADIHLIVRFILEHATSAMTSGGTIAIELARNSVGQAPCSPILSFLNPSQIIHLRFHLGGRMENRADPELLFDPLRQLQGEFPGLGIYTARHVARKLGGDIVTEDHGRQGISFHIFLPLASQEETTAQERHEVCPQGGTTVLLVEDDPNMASVLLRLLKKIGHEEVVVESDPKAALLSFQQAPFRYSLLLTDFFMPDMNGLELMRCIRATRPTLPVLLCTGQTDSLPQAMASQSRLVVLEKPVRGRDLENALRKLLNAPPPEITIMTGSRRHHAFKARRKTWPQS